MFKKVVENWRDFGRSHQFVVGLGCQDKTKRIQPTRFSGGGVRKLFHCGRQQTTELVEIANNDKKELQYVKVIPGNGSKVCIFRQK